MAQPDESKVCPFCKERVHPEAIKCRFCQSMLLPPQQPAAGGGEKPADGKAVTYVVDRGFMRFAKFVGGAVAIILAAGLYLVGFDLRRTMQTLESSRQELGTAHGELAAVYGELNQTREELVAAEADLQQLREDASRNTAEMNSFRTELTKAQEELGGTRRQFAASRAEIEGLVNTSREEIEDSRAEVARLHEESQLIMVGIRENEQEARSRVASLRELTPAEEGALEELRSSDTPPVGPRSRYSESLKLWNAGTTLRIRFLDGDPVVQRRVIETAREWERYANIRFDFGDHPDAQIRVSLEQPGNWSYLGTDALAIPEHQPTMNIGLLRADGSEKDYRRAVLKPFGHALGLLQEHQNPNATIPWDEEKVYSYYRITSGWGRDQTLRAVLRKNEGPYREFDRASIMEHVVPNELTIGDYEIGPNSELSESDKAFIAELYPGLASG